MVATVLKIHFNEMIFRYRASGKREGWFEDSREKCWSSPQFSFCVEVARSRVQSLFPRKSLPGAELKGTERGPRCSAGFCPKAILVDIFHGPPSFSREEYLNIPSK